MNLKKKAKESTLSAINAAIIVVFAGILLTFITILLFTSGYSMEINEEYYDGEEHSEMFLSSVAELFYKNSAITDMIKNYEFTLFSSVSGDEVICGKDGFLFEVKNRDTEYNFWKDHSGNLTFKEEEIEKIADTIRTETENLQKLGVDYYIVLIPNSQTVYPDKLPRGIAEAEGSTRRQALLTELEKRGIHNYIDTTISLERGSEEYVLFNNTENSLTPLGAFFAYREICERMISDGTPLLLIDESSLHFQLHLTKSRELATIADVSDYTENMTVSLTDRMKKYYTTEEKGDAVITKSSLYPAGRNGPKVLVSIDGENDASAFVYFFASTFGECLTEYTDNVTAQTFKEFAPEIYIQFIHESELGQISEAISKTTE